MERLLETILGSFLSDYVSTSKETATGPFKAYLSSSGISLHDIEFNTSKISLPSFSIDAATAKSLEVKVPWASLGTQPIEIKVSDIVLHLKDRADQSNAQPVSTTRGKPWEEMCVESDEPNTTGNNGSGWIGSSIQSRLLRYAVNASIFVENLSICICSSKDPSTCFVCQMDSLSLINIPGSDWISLVDDPSLWVSKGFLIRGFEVCFKKNDASLASVRVDIMQISGLVPMFALLEEDFTESNRIVPLSIDIQSLEILGSDDVPRLLERYYSDLFPWKPESLKKSTRNTCDSVDEDMKLLNVSGAKYKSPWTFDVGVSIGNPVVGINLTNLPFKPMDPAFLELRFNNVMCHLDLADKSWNFNAMMDSFEAILVDKAVDLEFCICRISSNSDRSKALTGTMVKSMKKVSYELHIEDLMINIPLEVMQVLQEVLTLFSGPEIKETSKAEVSPKFNIDVASIDIGSSFRGNILSLLMDNLTIYGASGDFGAASTAAIVLTSADDEQSPLLCKYLSNRVRLDLRVSGGMTKLMCTTFVFHISDLETLQRVVVLLNGSWPESFSEYATLNHIRASLEVVIGSKRRPLLLNVFAGTLDILTDFNCRVDVLEHQIFATTDISLLKSAESLQLKFGKLVLKLLDGPTSSVINIMLGNSAIQKTLQKQSLFIRSLIADMKILAFDMTPLFALVECLAASVKRPSVNSKPCETELRVDYAVITGSEGDHQVLSFWSRGLQRLKKTESEVIVIADAGVDLFSGDDGATVLEFNRDKEKHALDASIHFSEQQVEQEVQLSAFHVALQPVLLRLFDGILAIKNSITNSLKTATFLINPSQLVSSGYRKMTTRVRFSSSTLVLGPGKFSEKTHVEITLKGITMQHVQESLTKDRPWFLDIVQGETESKLLVSVETIVTNVQGGDHAGETFNIILPFSMAMSLHMWPIDSKKRLYLSTSPIIFQVKSSCWNNLRGLCDLYQADPSQQIEVARNDLLEGVAKDDLRCMPSIFLPGGSMSDLTGELHIELLVDNISSRSISWTYRNPRSIKHISFQTIAGRLLYPMQLYLYNSDGGASSSVCLRLEQDSTEHSIENALADHSNSWTLQWDQDLDNDSLRLLVQSIRIFSECNHGESSESWEMGFEYESSRISFLLLSAARTTQSKSRSTQWQYNLLGEVSLNSVSLSFQVWENAKFIELSTGLSMEHADPFDGCTLTLLRSCAIKFSYYNRNGGELVLPNDAYELKSFNQEALNDRTLVKSLNEHEICVQPNDRLEFLLSKYIYYDLKYLWRAVGDPVIPSYLEITNMSSSGIYARQWGCSEWISLHAQAICGWLLQPNKPRLLQFATSLEESAWSQGIDVFSDTSGSESMKSLATVLMLSFYRSDQLNITIEDGILLYNSTHDDVVLRVNEQESRLPACEMIRLLRSDNEVHISHSSGWSQKFVFDVDSEVLSKPTPGTTKCAFHLLVNKERSSFASYHICYPVTLSNLLNQTIKVEDIQQTVHEIGPMKSIDIFLPATGGKLCHLLVEESAKSQWTTLYCPGYGSQKSNVVIDPADNNLLVPAPGATSTLLDRYLLQSKMTEYNTIELQLLPLKTLQNSTDFHLEFQDQTNKLRVPPFSFAASTDVVGLVSVSIIIQHNRDEQEIYQTAPFDVSFSKIDAIDAVSSDNQRSFRFVLDVQTDPDFSKVEIKPLYYIENKTSSMIFDGFDNVYPPGSTRALLSPVDLVSGAVTVAQGKLRPDGTTMIIDNFTLYPGSGHERRHTLGNLSYSVSANGDATIFSIRPVGRHLTIKNLLSQDVSIVFLSRQNEMLRTFCILKGSSHVVTFNRNDHTIQIASADWKYNVELSTLNTGSIVDLCSLFLYRIDDTLELRELTNPIILNMREVRLMLSQVSFKLLNNPWMEDREEICLYLEGVQCQWLSGLPSSLESLNFSLQKYQVSTAHEEKTVLECLDEALSFHCEMCREPVSRIDFMSLDIGDPFLFIDDGIVAKMIETGIGAKSATSKGDHAERDEMQVLIKMLQIRSLTFNCDVHLSKSDWLPIAVDATRAKLSISEVDFKGERTLREVLSMLKEHVGDNLLRNAPYLVGSLQMLFDPVGLARSLRRGVVDLVRFPLEGLQRKSIISFVSGLGYGSAAFLREISSWSIGATIGFSQTMIKMMKSSSERRNRVAMVGHCQRYSDIRTVRQVIYNAVDLEEIFAGCRSKDAKDLPIIFWYRDVKKARIVIRGVDNDSMEGEKVSLQISNPVLMIHTEGLVVFAHRGKTPSFHIQSGEFTHTFGGECSVLIRSEQCRSFTDHHTPHSSDIYIHFVPQDIEVIRHLFAMISKD